MPPATSIFVGGGTPSLVPPADLVAVLDAVPRAPACEVTVECNPDTVTAELAESYAVGGVTRVSVGVQSMVDHVLHALGRTHDPANVRRAVTRLRDRRHPDVQPRRHLRRGGGVAGGLDSARSSASSTSSPPHVSAYALTVEPGTPLADDPAPASRRRRPGREVPVAAERAGGGGPALVRDLQLGPTGPRVPPQPALLVDGRVPGVRVRGALAPGGPPVLERADPRALHRGDRRRAGRPRPPASGSGRTSGGSRRSSSRSARAGGVPAAALPLEDVGDLVDVEGDRAVLTLRGRLLANEVALRLRMRAGGQGARVWRRLHSGCETSPRHDVPPLRPGVGCRPARRRPPRLPRLRRTPPRAHEDRRGGDDRAHRALRATSTGCFDVLGGTMGAAVGERVVRAYDRAARPGPARGRRHPVGGRPAAGGHGRPGPARPHRVGGQPPRRGRAAVARRLRLAHDRRGLRLLRARSSTCAPRSSTP